MPRWRHGFPRLPNRAGGQSLLAGRGDDPRRPPLKHGWTRARGRPPTSWRLSPPAGRGVDNRVTLPRSRGTLRAAGRRRGRKGRVGRGAPAFRCSIASCSPSTSSSWRRALDEGWAPTCGRFAAASSVATGHRRADEPGGELICHRSGPNPRRSARRPAALTSMESTRRWSIAKRRTASDTTFSSTRRTAARACPRDRGAYAVVTPRPGRRGKAPMRWWPPRARSSHAFSGGRRGSSPTPGEQAFSHAARFGRRGSMPPSGACEVLMRTAPA